MDQKGSLPLDSKISVDAKTGVIQDTGLRTMSGARHQHVLVYLREVLRLRPLMTFGCGTGGLL